MTEQNKKENKDEERYVFIYNPEQASFYMQNGVMAKSTGIHPKTKRVWFKFGFDDSSDVYGQWCVRNR